MDVRTQFLGPDDLLVACKVEFHDTLSADQVALAIREVETAIVTACSHAARSTSSPTSSPSMRRRVDASMLVSQAGDPDHEEQH